MSNIRFSYKIDSALNCSRREPIKVEEIVELHKESVSYTHPSSGSIRRIGETNYYSVQVNYRHNDAEFTKWRYMTKCCTFTGDNQGGICNVTPLTQGFSSFEILIDVTSQNGKYRAKLLLIELLPYKERQQVLEIWRGDEHIKSFEVSKIESHGLICTDAYFKSMSWSKIGEQDKLVYCAHDNKPKVRHFFCPPEKPTSPEPSCHKKSSQDQADSVSRAFKYRGNWGEATNETVHTCIAVIDVANDCKINVVKGELQALSYPVLCDNNTKVACIGMDTRDHKYGLIYCNNRPSNVLLFSIESGISICLDNLLRIGDNWLALHNLRVDNSGYKLVFAANETYGAHHQPSELFFAEIPRPGHKSSKQLEARRLCPGEHFNLAFQGLPINCFSDDSKHVYFTVEERMTNKLLRIDVETNKIDRIGPPTKAFEVFDINDNHILIAGSSIEQRPTVYFASLNNIELWYMTSDEKWINRDITYEYDELTDGPDCITLSAAYIRPVIRNNPDDIDVNKLPTIVMVHGGPHSSFILGYSPSINFFVNLNFRVLLLNYRGSYGFDKRHNDSLLGHIGYKDLSDCIKLVYHFKYKYSLDMNQLAIYGGSHGGFLAAHLSCQSQIKFKCAIIRNPVIDLYSMYVTSDIPDWVLAESLNSDQPEMHITPDMIDMLMAKSPSGKQLKVSSPTLLMLGKQDKRVPMSQGLLWAAACRRNDVDVEVRVYDDKHDLYKLDVYSDSMICSAIFLLRYCYKQRDFRDDGKERARVD